MKYSPFEPFEPLGAVESDLSEYKEDILPDPQIEPEETKFRSLWWLYLLLGLMFLGLGFRLWQLQIKEGWQNKVLAKDNRVRSQVILPARGEILDSRGKILASNEPSFALQILPIDLPKEKEKRAELYQKIQEAAGVESSAFDRIESELLKTVDPIVLAQSTDREQMMLWKLKLNGLPAVEVVLSQRRRYQAGTGLAHLLGYIGKLTDRDIENHPEYPVNSLIGKTGLEFTYDNILRGKPGRREVEVDSRGRFQRTLGTVAPLVGNSLVLNVDVDLQEVMWRSLEEAVKNSGGKSGAIMALNPQDGTVLGLVSMPDYDNNFFVSGQISQEDYQKISEDPSRPLLNRAIAGLYPPGSTIKPVVAAAALEEGVISEDTSILTPSEIKIGDWVFPDWKNHTGRTAVRRAIAESNNIFFYALGGGYDEISGLGVERLAKYFKKFALDGETGIDLPGEKNGLVSDADWKKQNKGEPWYLGDTYHLSIGQGDLLVTPLEMTVAISAIANGGKLVTPHLAAKVIQSDGQTVTQIEPQFRAENIINDANLKIVREGMRQTITSGSAQSLSDLPIEVAGKTGTAQYGGPEETHAWFACFAPYDDPQIVLVVFIEAGGQGHTTAAPVAKEVLRWYNENRSQ